MSKASMDGAGFGSRWGFGILSGEELLLWGTHSPWIKVSYPDLVIPCALAALSSWPVKGELSSLHPAGDGEQADLWAGISPAWWNPSTCHCLQLRWVFAWVFELNAKFFLVFVGVHIFLLCVFPIPDSGIEWVLSYCLLAKPLFLLGFLLF